MNVVGFSFIRNAETFDYPVVEAIQSILPLCNKIIVAVGNSNDNTRKIIEQIHPTKIEIIDTIWDDSLREGGRVLAAETNKAYHQIPADTDWCIYIQGDEVIHEKFYTEINQQMLKNLENKEVDGLLLKYEHFYGSYDFTAFTSNWYKHEIRILRKRNDIFSYNDAQGFRKKPNQKLRVIPINAYMYHYGWVRHPSKMQQKIKNFHTLWHSDDWIKENTTPSEKYEFANEVDALQRFTGSHPKVMQPRIEKLNWQFNYDPSFNKLNSKERLKRFINNTFGISMGEYKNYEIIK